MVKIMAGILQTPTSKSQKARLKMKILFDVLILENFAAMVRTIALPEGGLFINRD